MYQDLNEIVDPGPSRTFIFLDVREDSIWRGGFYVAMDGFPNQPTRLTFADYPASYHHRAGGFSFADGHSEIRRWVDPRTMPPLVKGDYLPGPWMPPWHPSPHNRDLIWLQEHSTRKAK